MVFLYFLRRKAEREEVYIYIYICTCTYMNVCIHVHLHVHAIPLTHRNTSMFKHVYNEDTRERLLIKSVKTLNEKVNKLQEEKSDNIFYKLPAVNLCSYSLFQIVHIKILKYYLFKNMNNFY